MVRTLHNPDPQNFGQPYSYVANSNQLDIIGNIGGTTNTGGNATTLLNAATSGATQITLQAGQGAFFPVGTYIDIGDEGCYESAKVTAVAGDKLTIDTNPGGATHSLVNSYAAGTNVCILQWITYKINGTTLTRDQHDGNGGQTVAYDITPPFTVQVIQAPAPSSTPPDGGVIQITLNGLTNGANAIQSQAMNTIHLRNP